MVESAFECIGKFYYPGGKGYRYGEGRKARVTLYFAPGVIFERFFWRFPVLATLGEGDLRPPFCHCHYSKVDPLDKISG